MLDWRRGQGQSIMKLIKCSSLPVIYAQWGVHLPNMSTMCILLYMKLIWYNGFPEIYAQLEEGVHLPNMSTFVQSAIYETYLV